LNREKDLEERVNYLPSISFDLFEKKKYAKQSKKSHCKLLLKEAIFMVNFAVMT